MATRHGAHETELVDEIDSIFDRAAAWAGSHPRAVVAAIAAVLIAAAAVGLGREYRTRSAARAEAETAAVYDAYLAAMGATPGNDEVPEPANPEVGRKARAEYSAKLLDAAKAHGGTPAAANARLLAAKLLDQSGEADAALAARKLAAEDAPPRSPVAAIAWTRYAVALESKDDLKGAAEAFVRAGEIASPGQALALGDAARCFALLGENEKALGLFARAEELGADVLPLHVRQRLLELRAATNASK